MAFPNRLIAVVTETLSSNLNLAGKVKTVSFPQHVEKIARRTQSQEDYRRYH